MLSGFGADAFAERARRELQATGAKARKRTVATGTGLTAQEAQIARLAGDGLTNPEIANVIGISETNAGTRLHRVIEKLRRACDEAA